MDDYSRVARIIRYLDEKHLSHPGLAELAGAADLSEAHFHRLFRRWAGVTPKDFLQCLTAEHAKERLRSSVSVLEAAIDVGMSGPGRLHDLFVCLEAATPGEFKSRGLGMEVEWGRAESPFGAVALAWTDRGVCHLSFEQGDGKTPPADLLSEWGNANFSFRPVRARRLAADIFDPKPGARQPLRALVRGTAFQVKVWRALLAIPEGCLSTYGQLAETIGRPGAARAVGSACGSNSIGYLIPCHRVIRETGIVRGYRWGSERKRAILAAEAARHPLGTAPA